MPSRQLLLLITRLVLALLCAAGLGSVLPAARAAQPAAAAPVMPAWPVVAVPGLQQPMALVPLAELLEDTDGRLDLPTARAATGWRAPPQHGHQGALAFGYTRSTYWVRWRLHNTSSQPQDLVVDLGNSRQDHVGWYLLRGPAGAPAQVLNSGDRVPFAQRALPARHFVLPLPLQPGEQVELLLRLASHDGMYEAMPLRLLPRELFLAEDEGQGLVVSLYHGGMLALALYNLLLYVATRERAFGLYVGYMLSLLVWNFTMQGHGHKYLWPDSPAFNNGVLTVSAAWAFGVFGLFSVHYLQLRSSVPRWLLRTNQALAWANIAVVVPSSFDFFALATATGQVLGVALVLVSLSTGVWLLRQGQRQARFFVLAFTLLGIGATAYVLQILGALPANALTTWGLQVGSSFEALVLAMGLADTMNTLKAEKLRAEQRARQAQEAANQQLEAQVAERTRALERANQALHTLAVTDALTGAFNRRHFNDLCAAALQQRPRGEPLAFCMFDLDHFKRYNDTQGHQAGDTALRAVAGAVQARLNRSSDTLFRLGGEEFGVLFTAGSAAQAQAFVETWRQAVRALAIPHPGNPQGCITASFGLGWFDDQTGCLKPDALYAAVDRALYAAKAAGRDRVWLLEGQGIPPADAAGRPMADEALSQP